MRRLTDMERAALEEVGIPGDGPVTDVVFREFITLGWGCWKEAADGEGYWSVTPAGREALRLDTLARQGR